VVKETALSTRRIAGIRRERALATRRRVLASAYKLFCERGYAGTTMDAIAKGAAVAVQTLYFTFHTKGALLTEVLDAAVVGFDSWIPPSGPLDTRDVATLRAYHTWFDPFEAAKSARAAFEVFIDGGVAVMERAAPLVATLREAVGDPEARDVYLVGQQRRAEAYEAVARILAKKPRGLRRGVTVRRATDVLFAVFSGETYQMLRERGWKRREIRTWLIDALGEQLLAP
jgi:AcrR family transcriptional regulator